MGLFDNIGKKLKEAADATANLAKDAANTVSGAAKSATDAVAGFAKDAANSVSDAAKKAPGAVADIAKSAADGVKGFILPREIKPLVEQESSQSVVLSTRCALKIFYYLVCVDGEIQANEEEKYDEIYREIDPGATENKDDIIRECQEQMSKASTPEEYSQVLYAGVDDTLAASKPKEDSFITSRLLIWNLLSIAFSDQDYNENERNLLQHIAEKLNLDQAVFLELESSMMTLQDIDKELDWIKTTTKPYLTIEAMVNELKDRKDVIFAGVKDLISL